MSEIEASHILCSTDSDSLEEATAKITAIAAEIEGGAAFADMASEPGKRANQ